LAAYTIEHLFDRIDFQLFKGKILWVYCIPQANSGNLQNGISLFSDRYFKLLWIVFFFQSQLEAALVSDLVKSPTIPQKWLVDQGRRSTDISLSQRNPRR